MYNDYFGLRESPFSIAPNPLYLYMSDRHRDALAHLLYGIQSDGGFLLLTGEVGTGKTTVCRCLLDQIPDDVDTAYILNPKLTVQELLATICDDFHIEHPDNGSIKTLVDRLNTFLLESHQANRRTVLIIDEAQNLSVDVLEQLRLLTNLETNHRKLLQIILLGQPELLTLLGRPELRQLSQRVTARFHLDALNLEEVAAYIQYRLEVAGAKGVLFPQNSVKRIYKISKGIPRLINLIADRSLLGTYVQNQLEVQVDTINKAAAEILGPSTSKITIGQITIALLLTTLVSIGLAYYYQSTIETNIVNELATEETNRLSILPNAQTIESEETDIVSNNSFTPIEDIMGSKNITAIYTEFFKIWNINIVLNSNSNPCRIAEVSDLQCYSNVGNLYEIMQLNRPVLIQLNKEYFIVKSISEQGIKLIANDKYFMIKNSDLLSQWDGAYTLLWKFSSQYITLIRKGDTGITVQHLQERLVSNGSDSALFTQSTFDSHLEDSVKRFQLTVGLVPDGIVGAQTWIHLNSRLDNNIPFIHKGEI
ncbi:MAG: general secretion pathway protein A [Candidatus Azotimanducaceae bacterium]|jgi:general secretion pathway protein A